MNRAVSVLVACVLASACRCDAGEPVTPGDGAPETTPVEAMGDPYDGLPPRGSVAPLARSVLVLDHVGKALGYGSKAADALSARSGESWTKRLVLFLDHGGTEQLEAAWKDVLQTCVESSGLRPEMKLKFRQAEARVNDAHADLLGERQMRRRLLAELAWLFVVLGPPTVTDAGKP